jgi:hypothetical protein
MWKITKTVSGKKFNNLNVTVTPRKQKESEKVVIAVRFIKNIDR